MSHPDRFASPSPLGASAAAPAPSPSPERLADPASGVDDLTFDAVVVGSGFGGAVMAARLSPHFAPGRLAVLERGREFVPGEFPRDTHEALQAVRSSANPLGLFDFHMHPDLDLLCANALGGGSTVYANVTLEPEANVFDAQIQDARGRWRRLWPHPIQRDALQPYFNRVRSMLAVEKYVDGQDLAHGVSGPDPQLAGSFLYGQEQGVDPHTGQVWRDYQGRSFRERPPLPKVELLRELARTEGASFHKAPLAVNFTRVGTGQRNEHGVVQAPCNLCGDCVTGCNRGAKNTLCMNYLPHARQHGARLLTQIEVLHLSLSDKPGYRYRLHTRQWQRVGRRWQAVSRRIDARWVVLSAGVVGSVGVLLRSQREGGLAFSAHLGQGVSGNADLISFSFNSPAPLDSAGSGGPHQPPRWEVGPTIVGYAQVRPKGEPPYLIQDGAWPAPLRAPLSRLLSLGYPGLWWLRFSAWRTPGASPKPSPAPQPSPDHDRGSLLNRSMVWLGIGHDSAHGRLELDRHGRVKMHWPAAGGQPVFAAMHDLLRPFSQRLQAQYRTNPRERFTWSGPQAASPISVHPLGGCSMSQDVSTGVTDDLGRVWNPAGGHHPGLYVCDASLCCGSLGANPSLTIAALAERAAEHLLAEDWPRDFAGRAGRDSGDLDA